MNFLSVHAGSRHCATKKWFFCGMWIFDRAKILALSFCCLASGCSIDESAGADMCDGGCTNEMNMMSGRWVAKRLVDSPIIDGTSHSSIGTNVQGPSVIRVPDWVLGPKGKYYLYFADHKGSYIRLAYADQLTGPWTIHEAGSLQLGHSYFPVDPPYLDESKRESMEQAFRSRGTELPHNLIKELTSPHIASPDVHIDNANKQIIMYYHGLEEAGRQITRVATSKDGINFVALPEMVTERTYLRTFWHGHQLYGMAMPGQMYRSIDNFQKFEQGPLLFNSNMRHFAVLLRQDTLHVFWTQVGDSPERIMVSTIDLDVDFEDWTNSEPAEVLRPERVWEGAQEPLQPSIRSVAYGLVNQLRDPAIFEESGRVFLLYAVGGESGIGLAELEWSGGS